MDEENKPDEIIDPYPELPGGPHMEYRHRVGLRNLRAHKHPNWEKPPEGGGRPLGRKSRSTILKELLELTFIKEGKKIANPLTGDDHMTIEEAIDVKLITKALNGDLKAMQEIKDSVHGKIPDKKALTDGDGEDVPLLVQIIDDISDKA